MRHVVSSDWHLSNGSITARTTDVGLLDNFLRWCELEADSLHLAGDIFDMRATTLKEVVEANNPAGKKVLEMVRGGKATYYYGNHDIPLRSRRWVKEYGAMDGTDIAIIHGHQFDPLHIIDNFKFDEFRVKVMKAIYDITGYNPDTYLEREKNSPGMSKAKDIIMGFFTNRARQFAKRRGYSGVVYGHMHLPGVYSEDPLIVNSGCCIEGSADYIVIENGDVSIRSMFDGF